MRRDVSAWKQAGNICVWRYQDGLRYGRGWQWWADSVGCQSLRDLLERMHKGGRSYRTLHLAPLVRARADINDAADRFGKLRIQYDPMCTELGLEPEEEVLILTVGDRRIGGLAAAIAEMEIRRWEFDFAPSDDPRAERWMFW